MNQITSPAAPIVAVFESAQSIRIILIDNEPWFVASDVCGILGYTNGRKAIADHCRALGVTKRDTPAEECDVTNRYATSKARLSQEMTYINEGNLYRLVIKSRMPAAEKFEAWVCDEVLPSIRKQGYYVAPIAEPDPAQDEALSITEAEAERLHKIVGGIAYCIPTMTRVKVAIAIYGRIKAPIRIGRIDDLPAMYLDRTMRYLERTLAEARQHNRRQSAADEEFLSRMLAGSEVAA